MPTLMDPIRIGSRQARNRLMLAPMLTLFEEDLNGWPTEWHRAYYAARAADGPGILVLECAAICPENRNYIGELGMYDDRFIAPMGELAKAVKQGGALAILQIHHAGRNTAANVNDHPPAVSEETLRDGRTTRAMTTQEVQQAVRQYADACRRAAEAGFDGIELHGCHNYLLDQFASPVTNTRTDEYGGETAGERMRFAREVIRASRAAVPEGFIVGYRMGFNNPGIQEGLAIAKAIEEEGVDYLSVSSGIGPAPLTPPEDFPYHWITYAGSLVKQQAKIPVAAVYNLHTLDKTEAVVGDGVADMAAVARPYFLNADWLTAQREGRKLIRCLNCKNGCRIYRNQCPQMTLPDSHTPIHV